MHAPLPFILSWLANIIIYAHALKLDPIKNFCVRYDHQSTVKNGVLYIGGGVETFVDVQKGGVGDGGATLGYNDYLIKVNLTTSWDWKTNISETFTNITKNPKTGSLPPQGVRGAFFQGSSDDNNFYYYGGTTSFLNTSFPGWTPPAPSAYSLWSYDTVTEQWGQYDLRPSIPNRPNSGAAAEAPDQKLMFYFNGVIDNGSSTATENLGPSAVRFLDGMVVMNMTDNTARNLSTTAVSQDLPRARGNMQYIPNIGKNGILVLIGGSNKPVDQLNDSDNVGLATLDEVDIFDVSSLYNATTPDGVWYKQKTTGQNGTGTPNGRVDFCLVMVSTPDFSSHNIYMYGGRNTSDHYFDDIWVLSLPSFTWTEVYSGNSPRFGHTCHLVSNRTLLTVGGTASLGQTKGVGDSSALECDWEVKSVGILDLSDIVWGSVYDANAPAYKVPQKVVSIIGGSTAGNATMKAPLSGFSNKGLAQLFGAQVDEPTKPTSASSTINRSAIIEGTIGGIAVLVLVTGALWFVTRHRRRRHIDINIDEPVFEKDVRPDVELAFPKNGRSDEEPIFEKDVHPDVEHGVQKNSRSDEEPIFEKDVQPDVDEMAGHMPTSREIHQLP